MSQIKTNEFMGDSSFGRHVNVGGSADIKGNTHIHKNVKIEGWLDAPNIKGPNKGMFRSEERLKASYPQPGEGWWALVGESLPAPLYIAEGGEWVSTGKSAGNPTLDVDSYNAAVVEMEGKLSELSESVAAQGASIETLSESVTTQGASITALEGRVNTLSQSVSAQVNKIDTIIETVNGIRGLVETQSGILTELGGRVSAAEKSVTDSEINTFAISADAEKVKVRLGSNKKELTEELESATKTKAGVMSASDKETLDGIKEELPQMREKDNELSSGMTKIKATQAVISERLNRESHYVDVSEEYALPNEWESESNYSLSSATNLIFAKGRSKAGMEIAIKDPAGEYKTYHYIGKELNHDSFTDPGNWVSIAEQESRLSEQESRLSEQESRLSEQGEIQSEQRETLQRHGKSIALLEEGFQVTLVKGGIDKLTSEGYYMLLGMIGQGKKYVVVKRNTREVLKNGASVPETTVMQYEFGIDGLRYRTTIWEGTEPESHEWGEWSNVMTEQVSQGKEINKIGTGIKVQTVTALDDVSEEGYYFSKEKLGYGANIGVVKKLNKKSDSGMKVLLSQYLFDIDGLKYRTKEYKAALGATSAEWSEWRLYGYASASNSINIDELSPSSTGEHTFESAIAAVPENQRTSGREIVYYKQDYIVERKIFVGEKTDWEDKSFWRDAMQSKDVTYKELIEMRDGYRLTPGMNYRITDYETTVANDPEAQSAGHPFDVVVMALDQHTLSERAWAIRSARDAEGYFAGVKMEAWQVWYCADNDTKRFQWADVMNGKGVIYRLIDEWGNDCPYDFKNIQFKRYKTSGDYLDHNVNTTDWPYEINYILWAGMDVLYLCELTTDSSDYKWYYTFNYEPDETSDASLINHVNADLGAVYYNKACNSNKMAPYYISGVVDEEIKVLQALNNIVLISCDTEIGETVKLYCNEWAEGCYNMTLHEHAYGNTFGKNCYNVIAFKFNDNTFGNACSGNAFGNGCYNNTFGDRCSNNILGYGCQGNVFGNDCGGNRIGSNSENNVFGESCTSNDFGNGCCYNLFGINCGANTFGINCSDNTIGDHCCYNTFGDHCCYNTFGKYFSSSTLAESCVYNTFGNNCRNIKLYHHARECTIGNYCSHVFFHAIPKYFVLGNCISTLHVYYELSDSDADVPLMNVKIMDGTKSTTLKLQVATNKFRYVGQNTAGELKIWIPADLVE